MKPPAPPLQAGEREMLESFLDYFRALLRHKASGLSDEQLHQRLLPSTLTLGNMLHHLAAVEYGWFHEVWSDGEPLEPWASAPWDEDRDWEMTVAPEVPTEILFERYDAAVARSRAVLATVADLDELSAKSGRDDEAFSMRWILVHMIEEYARHCGHADFIRESIDGAVGDFGD